MGIALLALFLAGGALDVVLGFERWPRAAPQLRRLALVLAACLAVVPLNPNGVRMYWYPLQTLHSASMQNYIDEWFSPNFHELKYLPLTAADLGHPGRANTIATPAAAAGASVAFSNYIGGIALGPPHPDLRFGSSSTAQRLS